MSPSLPRGGRLLVLALVAAALATSACGTALIRRGGDEGESEALRREILELRRRATVSEVEATRLRQEVERLEAELAAARRSAPVTPAAEPLERAEQEPEWEVEVIRRQPIEESDLEDETLAEELVSAVLDADPEPPPAIPGAGEGEQAVYDRAYTLFHQKRYAAAETAFRSFLTAHPRSELADNAQFWIGECRFARGDFASALEAFTATVRTYPAGNKVSDAMLKAGRCLEALGDPRQAGVTYREVVERFPGSAAAALAQDRLEALR